MHVSRSGTWAWAFTQRNGAARVLGTGLRRVQRHFTWERVALQMSSVYRAVLARSPGDGTASARQHMPVNDAATGIA